MLSRGREVEVAISSAKDIKNVNWRNGPNKPYAVVWVDPKYKSSTRVDEDGDTCPSWNETFVIPLPLDNLYDDDNKVYINIVHAGREENTKPLIGSAYLSLRDVIDDVGFGVANVKTINLKRPSGRPHGILDVTVAVRETWHHAPPQHVYGNTMMYGETGYGYTPEKEKGSKFGGMGTGLAIGAVAGVLGGVALAEGLEAMEDNVAEEAAEDDLDSGEEDSDGGDDDGDF
ncbi:hypothetical protein EUTSA_v10004867mg [Eutrema salsugineum]|uniref:C2 domain-containing protein n=1 Tax=Eutrema salsugineum TaxID=72664 RepID=V4KPQ4_EUTSA|nr:uncharacterized protein LOC18011582 [Eutrema salsugineum]ESQ31942.1 hypothetical protein EUTSA_v10004867mg [Eutrema salsugineum]